MKVLCGWRNTRKVECRKCGERVTALRLRNWQYQKNMLGKFDVYSGSELESMGIEKVWEGSEGLFHHSMT